MCYLLIYCEKLGIWRSYIDEMVSIYEGTGVYYWVRSNKMNITIDSEYLFEGLNHVY